MIKRAINHLSECDGCRRMTPRPPNGSEPRIGESNVVADRRGRGCRASISEHVAIGVEGDSKSLDGKKQLEEFVGYKDWFQLILS